jgi:hypothetical protein
MSDFFGDGHALLVLVIAGFLPNGSLADARIVARRRGRRGFRAAGLGEGGRDRNSRRVIAQIPVAPPGAPASVPDWLRYAAVAAGVAAFILTRRSIFAGVVCGEAVMLAGKWWLG